MTALLAPYAVQINNSRGRRYSEPVTTEPHSFLPDTFQRDPFQRDRDRIIHCNAFRRLMYKTQVFVNYEGDMYRTRLTHSLEVAQIGRSVAIALNLNEALTEAICLAHDLGHPPFGHAGQDALNKCMREYGGFEHNLQSLRTVDVLEKRYAAFEGLNLMYETREGILKHCSKRNATNLGELGLRFIEKRQASLEAQVADLADAIAYNHHDLDDGLRAGILNLEALQESTLFSVHTHKVQALYPKISGRLFQAEIIRSMINSVVLDLIQNSQQQIEKATLVDLESVHTAGQKLVGMSPEMQAQHLELKSFLYKNFYKHKKITTMNQHASKVIHALFEAYMENTELLPEEYQQEAEKLSIQYAPSAQRARTVCDYIAGMTDRFAQQEYQGL